MVFIVFLGYSYLTSSFYLNQTGDDHEYLQLAKLYSNNFEGLLKNESNNYALPYASIVLFLNLFFLMEMLFVYSNSC